MLFVHHKDKFEELLHKANFDTRVCKFQIKAIGVNKYFNILEIYAKDTQQMLDRKMAEMKKMMEMLEKQKEQKIE